MRASLRQDASPGDAAREAPRAAPPQPRGLPDVSFTTGAWRERMGWWRALIVALVVCLAAAAVVVPSAAVLRHYRQLDAAPAPVAASTEVPADNAVPAASTPAPPIEPPPAVPTTMPPAALPSPADAAPAPAATKASGRAVAGSLAVTFVMDSAQLRAGSPSSISVSATGEEADRVSSVQIALADGSVLASGNAEACDGPAFPWTQSFPVTFPAAESTQVRVTLTTCAGGSLVATALVDVQP